MDMWLLLSPNPRHLLLKVKRLAVIHVEFTAVRGVKKTVYDGLFLRILAQNQERFLGVVSQASQGVAA